MAVSVKHFKQSTKDDGTDSSRVRPSDWNAEHVFLAPPGTVLGVPAGATPPTGAPVEAMAFSSVLPAGMILPWAGPINYSTGVGVPVGWLLCNGGTYPRAAPYDLLFTVIQTTYGNGDNSGITFSVPNLQGRTIAMLDSTGTILTNSTMVPNGNTLGAIGGSQLHSHWTNLTGLGVAGGIGDPGMNTGLPGAPTYPWHEGVGGVWGQVTGNIGGTTDADPAEGRLTNITTSGGSTAAAPGHTHTWNMNVGSSVTNNAYVLQMHPADDPRGVSRGKFYGNVYREWNGVELVAAVRQTDNRVTVQPTLLMHYLIKY